jgi:hypothetical protein
MAVNGNYLGLYVNGQRIALTKSNDFASKMAMIDITTKDSSGNKEVQPGLKEGSCSMEGICTSGLTNLLQWPEAFDNAIWVKAGTGSVSGTKIANDNSQILAQTYTFGTGTQIKQTFASAPSVIAIGDKIVFSISLKGTGKVNIQIGDSIGSTTSSDITLSSNWTRYEVLYTVSSLTGIFAAINKATATTVSLFGPQVEESLVATSYKGSKTTLLDLQTIAEARTKVTLLYSDYLALDFKQSYDGYISDLMIKSSNDSAETFTCSFMGTGTQTITNV